jgi:predicted lipid-binding transport protein (Tim44 family)
VRCFFSGDLGGLLGLFLGGSAISVFEVIDLFAYNLALQLLGYVIKKQNKMISAEEGDNCVMHDEQQQHQLATVNAMSSKLENNLTPAHIDVNGNGSNNGVFYLDSTYF